MWNEEKSLALSRFCVKLFLVLLTAAVCTAPLLVKWYLSFRPFLGDLRVYFCVTIYCCAVPGFILLFSLDRLLRNIRKQEVFERTNIRLLRRISWSCIAIGVMTFLSAFYYLPFLPVSVACAFMGLIIRIIKNVFEQAADIKSENDFTI